MLWTCPSVDGPRAVAGDIGVSGQLGTARDWQNDANWRFGTLRMDGVTPPLPFIVYCIRERKASAKQMSEKIKFGIQTKNPSDWLTLGIPIGVLCSAWSVDYSWVTANQPWLSDLCARLAGIADHLHRRAPIASGVMGEEASGCYRRPTFARALEAHQDYPPLAVLTAEIVEARGGFVIPSRLWALLAPRATSITMRWPPETGQVAKRESSL